MDPTKNEYSNLKEVFQDWRWIVGVSLLLALPTYGLMPIPYAVITHLLTTLAYVGLLRSYGPGHVIEWAMLVLTWATFLGLIGRLCVFGRSTTQRLTPHKAGHSRLCRPSSARYLHCPHTAAIVRSFAAIS